jgi:tetratricopeptide (TPR) repeat protein
LSPKRCLPSFGCLASVLILLIWIGPAAAQILYPGTSSRLDREIGTASSLVDVGDFERALTFLDYLEKTYGWNTHINAIYKRIYVETKMYPELEAAVLRELAVSPDNPLILAELGSVRFLLNSPQAADSLWNLALERGEGQQIVYLTVAGYRLRFGDYDGAINVYELGRRKLNNPYLFSSNLADIYESKREYDRAVEEYLLQLQQHPGHMNAVAGHVRGLLEDSDHPEEIVSAVKNAVGGSDDPELIRMLLGSLYIQLGRFDQALDTYRRIGAGKRDDGASLVEFARRCYDYRAYQAAVRAVGEYFAISEDRVLQDQALLLRGQAERALDSVDQAINTLLPLYGRATNPKIRDLAGYTVGSIYATEKGNCDQAVSIWNDLVRTASSRELINMTRVDLASCLIRMERLETAESLLTAVSSDGERGPVSEEALFLQGEIALFRGDYGRAAGTYRRLVRESPGCDFANNALERLMVIEAENTGDEPSPHLNRFASGARARAMGRLEEAARIFSDEEFLSSAIGEQALFAAAVAYREAGKNQMAVEILNRYIARYPGGFYVDRALLNLGDIYLLKKETYSLARDAFNKVLEEFPDGPVSDQARGRLKQLESLDEIG